jgi:hypothetical protein
MSVAVDEAPRVLHALPGRVRVHIPGWSGQGKRNVETVLRSVQGVHRVRSNVFTGNILIYFDPLVTHEQTILAVLQTLTFDMGSDLQTEAVGTGSARGTIPTVPVRPGPPHDEPTPPPVIRERQGRSIRARIAVRGLDRDPHLARRVVEHLEKRYPGVRATASHLTGRVLVEFTEHEAELEDLLADIADLELPALPDEDRPTSPLDPGPLVQSATRTVGSALGLGLHAIRRLLVQFQDR